MHICSKKILLSVLVSLSSVPFFLNSHVEKLLYATLKITDPRIIGLVQSQAFKRLRDVRQYGIDAIVLPKRKNSANYNRAVHSMGVYYLLHHFGAPFEEQVAGLLHDASHTAFSHGGDQIFRHKDGKDSYQDLNHIRFLSSTDIPQILQRYGLTLNGIDHKNAAFTCLEQPLPDICADRLEYNLAGGILEGLITRQEARDMLNHLKFENNRWYFTDADHAQKFARISLWHTEHLWGAQMGSYVSHELALAIQKAFEIDILTPEEIIYGTDDVVWQKLCSCKNAQINYHVHNLLNAYNHEAEINQQPRKNKFRGINPWVLVEGSFKRLTEIDKDFEAEFNRVKADSY